MSDPSYYEAELEDLYGDLKGVIQKLKSRETTYKARRENLEVAQGILNKIKKTYKRYNRSFGSLTYTQEYERKSKVHESEIAKFEDAISLLANEHEDVAPEDETKRLLAKKPVMYSRLNDDDSTSSPETDTSAPTIETGPNKSKAKVKEEKLANELFGEIFKLQGEQWEVFQRIEQMVDESQMIATESLATLRIQGEQFAAIDQELDSLKSSITRARKEITSFARQMNKHKLIYLLIIAVLLLFLGCILFLIFAPIIRKFIPKWSKITN